ncbi:hypothetical protein [Plantactinospora sp. B5E13]|uniref:hypothetical protein n=1 Tax=unclassified Plantactinospora TaxID=2631981 RepID=UPI00325F5F3D
MTSLTPDLDPEADRRVARLLTAYRETANLSFVAPPVETLVARAGGSTVRRVVLAGVAATVMAVVAGGLMLALSMRQQPPPPLTPAPSPSPTISEPTNAPSLVPPAPVLQTHVPANPVPLSRTPR